MARRRQEGNLFFRLDVDFFSDRKVKILKARYGADGITLYLYLLCEIYKTGYYLKIEDQEKFLTFQNEMEEHKREKDFKNRMKAFREIYEKNKPLKEFDRKIFESVVDKIILGKTYENGENNPYSVTFIFKTGFETEEKCKTKKNKSEECKSDIS